MTKENFEVALGFLFPSEGGYVNDKNDKGGPTNMGVTQTTYNAYNKKKGFPLKNVKYITKAEAINLYYEDYWKVSGADDIDDTNMAVLLFDTAVLHGPYRAKQYYKQSGGDIKKFLAIRKQSYDKIIQNDPTQKKFYNGWNNRVNHLKTNIDNGNFISKVQSLQQRNLLNSAISDPQKDDASLSRQEEIYRDKESNLFKLGIEKNVYLPSLEEEIDSENTEFPLIQNEEFHFDDENNGIQSEGSIQPVKKFNDTIQEVTNEDDVYTGMAVPISSSTVPNQKTFFNTHSLTTKSPSQNFSDMIRQKYQNKLRENNRRINFHTTSSSKSNTSGDGKWITVRGKHIFIEK